MGNLPNFLILYKKGRTLTSIYNAQAQGHYEAERGLWHLATNERRGVMSLEANCYAYFKWVP